MAEPKINEQSKIKVIQDPVETHLFKILMR